MSTKIEWCDETINPIQDKIKGKSGRGYHCTKIGAGCKNCYAESANMIRGNGLPFDGRKAEFEIVESMLEKPLRWKKPRRIFIQSMGDLFHEDISVDFMNEIYSVICRCSQHIFIVPTKRPENIKDKMFAFYHNGEKLYFSMDAMPKNLWLGVSVSTQEDADRLIPILLQIPAAVRFVSVEPMLEDIDLYHYVFPTFNDRGLDWLIIGCESGPPKKRRRCLTEWIENLVRQGSDAGVPVFVKQAFAYGGKLVKMPEILGRVWKEYPK